MKKNKNIKILLPIVIIIWGILFYKIYDAFRPSANNIRTSAPETYIPSQKIEKDSFSLLPLDSDPFLGTFYVKKESTPSKGISLKKKVEETVWPEISYLGIVSDKEASTSVFVLQIQGQQYLVKKGDTIRDLHLVKGSNTSVALRYKGKTKNYPIM